ncbi:MAG TPA: hypothetical protein VKK79_17420, partial [Candidatus Lokiarchaeia archaeon]|nr:hypothetical protein [Candidatus Lokiarchaeia archaeon]
DIDLALLKLEQEILRDGSPGGNEDQLKEVEREIKEIELGMSNDAKSSNALSAQPAKNPPSGGSELVDEPSIPLTSNRDVTPASEIPPSNSELEYFGTEECAQVFSDSPDYVHPSLTTAQNLLFLKTRAQQAWKIGDCPLAYRLWYATFNNELRLATRHVPQIPEGDIFLAGKYIWDYLASRGIKCDATIMNYFLGAHSAHARLLRSASFLSKADVGKVLNPIENGVEELLYKASILPVVQNNLADVGFDHQGDVNAAP